MVRRRSPSFWSLVFMALASCKGDPTAEPGGVMVLGAAEESRLLGDLGLLPEQGPNGKAFIVQAAFVIDDSYPGDFGVDTTLPLVLPKAPDSDIGMILARVEPVTEGGGAQAPVFVAPARYRRADGAVTVFGSVATQRMGADRAVSAAAGQTGIYLLLGPYPGTSLTLVDGTVMVNRVGLPPGAGQPIEDGVVVVSTNPVVARIGAEGRFITVSSDGRDDEASRGLMVTAVRNAEAALDPLKAAPSGTPLSTARQIPTPAVADAYSSQIPSRAEASGAAEDTLRQSVRNLAVLSTFESAGMPVISTHLVFDAPRLGNPFQLADDRLPPARPTPDLPAEILPPVGHPVFRRDRDDAPQTDLGCSGFDARGEAIEFVRAGEGIEDVSAATGTPGWRAFGDARYAYDLATMIFGAPSAQGDGYLDNIPGYCVVTTGDGQWVRSGGDVAYAPGPELSGHASWIAQRLLVPTAARRIEIRYAVFSQEAPLHLAAPLPDAVVMRLDERTKPILAKTLGELAAPDDWRTLPDSAGARLWDVERSRTAAPGGYQAFLPARVACMNLDGTNDAGRELTLRIGVMDGGDPYLDTALLIDSVVFGTETCL